MTKKVKQTGLLALLLCIVAPGFAQTEAPVSITPADSTFRPTHTLLSHGRTRLRYLGLAISPEYQLLGAAGTYGGAAGNALSVILNRRWSFGVAGLMSQGRFDPKLSDNDAVYLRYATGGGLFEFTPRPYKVLHLSFPLMVGGGLARLDSLSYHNGPFDGRGGHHFNGFEQRTRRNRAEFWIIQPGMRLELNVARFARLYAGAAWRLAAGPVSLDYPNDGGGTSRLNAADLSGLSVQAGVKLGFFEYRLDRLKHRKTAFKRRHQKE
jgi:hypothetical protein